MQEILAGTVSWVLSGGEVTEILAVAFLFVPFLALIRSGWFFWPAGALSLFYVFLFYNINLGQADAFVKAIMIGFSLVITVVYFLTGDSDDVLYVVAVPLCLGGLVGCVISVMLGDKKIIDFSLMFWMLSGCSAFFAMMYGIITGSTGFDEDEMLPRQG